MSRNVQAITSGHEAGNGISILSFDGGGPGTLSQMLILKDLFRRLEHDLKVEEDTLRPADYFDLMGGVGFGGFSALMLGHLRMSLEKTMEELANIGAIMFPHDLNGITTPEGRTNRLRGAIEAMLQRNGFPVDIKLKDQAPRRPRCKVVVFAATVETGGHCHPFRTYASRYRAMDCSFVDAACATLVIPILFSPIAVGPSWARQEFVGTPLGYNNPMRQVLQEARLDFGNETQVALLLNLGSGRPSGLNLDSEHPCPEQNINFLTRVAYDCERVARELSDQLFGVEAYKRLNVNQGMENIEMLDWHKLGTISSHTMVYLQSSEIMDELDFCSDALQNRTATITLGQLNRTGVAIFAKFNPHQYGNHLALSPMAIKQIGDIVRGGVKGITLVDAIGNFIPISMELCRTYSMLKDVISAYFRHQHPPGRDLVERGDYRLVYGNSRTRVEPTMWTYTVNTGLTVEMSMVLRRRNGNGTTCPRCNEEYHGEVQSGWVDWKFQLEDEATETMGEEVEDLISPAIASQSTRSESVQSRSTRSPSPGPIPSPQLTEVGKKKRREEQMQYRLISVINLSDAFPNVLDSGTQAFPSSPANSSGHPEGNLLEDSTSQDFIDTAWHTLSPGAESPPQPANAKGYSPLTLDNPKVVEYLELAPHLRSIVEYLLGAQWYKEGRQEPLDKNLPRGLRLTPRQSSSTPNSIFGGFFSARQPYDCLLCPQVSPKPRRTLERALGHARGHFNFKPIRANEKAYTDLNTKNDQERRAKKPAKFCIPCGMVRVAVQNCQRHAQSNAHRKSAASYAKDQKIWSDTQ